MPISISCTSQKTVTMYLPTLPNVGTPTAMGPYHWLSTRPISFSLMTENLKARLTVSPLRSYGINHTPVVIQEV